MAGDVGSQETAQGEAQAVRPAADTRKVGKRLIVFSDGTGNSSAKLFKTNVWRLYEAVDLGPAPKDDPVTQIAFYDDGVGSSSFKPLAVLGGALGVGLARNVRDIYAFICRHWAEGDELYCFGFSRGAFTIRVLTGLIECEGIITDFDDESDLRRKVAVAYRNFRRHFEPHPPARWAVWLVRNLRDKIITAFDGAERHTPPSAPRAVGDTGRNARARITFVGLWDTVDAYGLPIDEMTRAWDKYIWPLSMRDRSPAKCIDRAVHLLSLDDERNTFHPVLWDERDRSTRASEQTHVDEATIAQVWFSGVHADVGGGYPNDRLSYVPLMFMIDRIDRTVRKDFGLRLTAGKVQEYAAYADLDGLEHDSRKGLGGYYRYLPRRFDLLSLLRRQPRDRSGQDPAFSPEGINPDIPTPLIHETVLRRIEHGSQGYAPIILPLAYKVVTRRGQAAPEGLVTPQGGFSTIDRDPAGRAAQQAQLWNWVWLRRIVYFATVFFSGWLALMPFFDRIERTDGDDPSYESVLSAVPELLGGFLPSLAQPWIDVYRAHPYKALALAGAMTGGLLFGAWLAGQIRDAMQHVWRGRSTYAGLPWRTVNDFIYRLRTSPTYLKVFFGLKTRYLPAFFAVVFAYIGLALLSQGVFVLREGVVPACLAGEAASAFDNGRTVAKASFDPKQLCWGSGIQLQGGRRYRLSIQASENWADASIPADLYGLQFSSFGAFKSAYKKTVMFLALPFRRYITGRWFSLYARVGPKGRDVQLLANSVRPPSSDLARRRNVQFEFEAHQNGELFLFVNDAVPIPLLYNFYGNNKGSATIQLEQLSWQHGPADPER